MPEYALDGIGVLITRPRRQAQELADETVARGGRAVVFPVLEIVPGSRATIEDDAGKLSPADITVFISRNAVDFGLDYAEGELAAIGPTTAKAIEDAGRRVDIRSARGFDSEHLLGEAAFEDVRDRTVRIIRGDAGREKLADVLRERGANVEYLSTYERRLPEYDESEIAELEADWLAGNIDAVVVMSMQSLANLRALLPPHCLARLNSTVLVTPSERVLKEALQRVPGCRAILSAGPQTDAIADSLTSVRKLRRTTTPKAN